MHEDALSVEASMINSYLAGTSGVTVPINPGTDQGVQEQHVPTEEVPAYADILLGNSSLDDVSISSSTSTNISVQEQIATM